VIGGHRGTLSALILVPRRCKWNCDGYLPKAGIEFHHSSLASHFAPIPGELKAEAAFHAVPRSGSLDFPWDRGHPSGKK